MALTRALQGAPWRIGDASSRLILKIAAGEPVELDRPLTRDEIELAVHHGLTGLMTDHDHGRIKSAAFPIYARLAARHGIMRTHLRRILQLLHAAGVRATVVKGLHLGQWAYRNPMHRTTTDIDLLVPADEVDRAIEVLAADEAVQTIPAKTPKADKRNIPLSDPSGVIFTLDLHWDLFSYSQLRRCADGATDWAWDNAVLVEDHPLGPMWELPEAARIAFLCTHALLDHRFRLILFRDLVEVAATDPDWDDLLQFVERWNLRSTTYLALLMAVGLLEAAVPQRVLERARKTSLPVLAAERLLRTTDLVQFDGHRSHPLNLAIVLVHDDIRSRMRLLALAPAAFPRWQARVAQHDEVGHAAIGRQRQPPMVIHLLPVDLARGAQTYAKALGEALDDHHAHHVTMTIFESESGVLETDIGLEVVPGRGRSIGFDVRAAYALRRALRRRKPAVIVAHGGEPLKYAAIVAPRKAKLVYYKIGTAAGQFKNELRRRLYALLLKRVDVLAGVSREMVDEAQSTLDVPPERTVYIPNGRDPAAFSAASHETNGQVRACFVGHLTRTKRPERFVEVIGALRDRGLAVSGIMAGDGPLEPDMLAIGPGAGVEVLGRRSDVPDLLAAADMFLFTSMAEGEGMPGVLVEAGMAALPTVSTDVPGARTVIDEGKTGFVVPVDDIAAFCDAAARLADDIDLRRKMGAAARERCLEHFTLEASTERWRVLFDALLTGAPIPEMR